SVAPAPEHLTHLAAVPKLVEEVLRTEAAVKQIAKKYLQSTDFLFLGRATSHAVAMEGALKLKEISYIHAEGYAGGEMKHGPIALIDEKMPVVIVAPSEPAIAYEKMIGNVQEAKARGGRIIAIVDTK